MLETQILNVKNKLMPVQDSIEVELFNALKALAIHFQDKKVIDDKNKIEITNIKLTFEVKQ